MVNVVGGEFGGVFDDEFAAGFVDDFEGDSRGGDDDVLAVLAEEAILENGAVEGAEEAETPALTESVGGFFGEGDGTVIDDELFNRVVETGEFGLVDGEGADKDHGLRLFETFAGLDELFATKVGECISDLGFFHVLHAGIEIDVADLACAEGRGRGFERVHNSDITNDKLFAGSERDDGVSGFEGSFKDADEHHDSSEVVVPRVDEEELQRVGVVSYGSGDLFADDGKDSFDIETSFGRDHDRI